jgi:hypothetical protein
MVGVAQGCAQKLRIQRRTIRRGPHPACSEHHHIQVFQLRKINNFIPFSLLSSFISKLKLAHLRKETYAYPEDVKGKDKAPQKPEYKATPLFFGMRKWGGGGCSLLFITKLNMSFSSEVCMQKVKTTLLRNNKFKI